MTAVQPPQGIDPAEALIVVVGLEPFLGHTSRDLGGAIVKSEALPETIEGKIYRFINREERAESAELPPFDFKETVKLLDQVDDEGNPVDPQIEKTIAAFGGQHDLALRVGSEVTRVHAYVRQQIPRRVHISIAGPEPLDPAPSEFYRFRRTWRLAEEPLSLFDELQEFAVSRGQVKDFSAMFPTTFATLWPTVQRSLTRYGEKISRQKETLLRVLGQQESQSLQLATALAPIFAQEQANQAAREAQRSTKAAASSEATATQKLEAGT